MNSMDFAEYFKKMCGNSTDEQASETFNLNEGKTPFNKKELRWLETQLEDSILWADKKNKSDYMYKNMLKKVRERLELL